MAARALFLAFAAAALPAGLLAAPESRAKDAGRQPVAEIRAAVEAHLRRETRGLPGTASFSIGRIDARLNQPACPALQTFTPAGARPWGSTAVGVRCLEPAWSIRVPVAVRVQARYAVAARPLAAAHALAESDIAFAEGDLAQLPAGVVTRSGQAIGQSLAVALAAGQPLRRDMLRAPIVVQPGQTVRVVSRGTGFEISAEGQALAAAPAGQMVKVRMGSGRVIHGIARPGAVVELVAGS